MGCALVGALRAQSNYATPYAFSTLAGSAGVIGSTDGAGSAARFSSPAGLAVDGGGNVYVADYNNHTIRKITPAGVASTFAGAAGVSGSTNGPTNAARFFGPAGMAFDAGGNMYVAEYSNHLIRKITPAGTVSALAGATSIGAADGNGSSARFFDPEGVAVDRSGNVYVADTGNHTIRKITPAGDVSTLAGLALTQGSADGTGAAARFIFPISITIDASDNLYVADYGNHLIRKITPAGVVSTLAGGATLAGSTDGTGTAARFNNPNGVAVDAAGNVFVVERINQLVRKITPAGVVTTLAGSAGLAGSANGTGSAARFSSAVGIVVSATGVVYVADTINCTIRAGVPAAIAAKLPGFTVPPLIPAGATTVEARALAEQPGLGVLVAISGAYAVRPSSGGAQALVTPNYTNPQPYNLSYVVRLLANGQPDPAFTSAPGGDGTVNTVAVQADGKILVGGTFASFNTVFFKNLARLQADGKADATFLIGSGPDAQVNALAVQADGKILVGGAFQNFGGQSRPYLLRLSTTGAVETAFAPALNGAVNALVLQPDGKILVGGNFTSAGGAARSRIARLLPSGAIDSTFDPGAGANDEVVALLLQGNGAIVAGGDFTSLAGQGRGRIARLLPTGALDPAFLATATADKTILALGVQTDGNLLISGAFTAVNGVTRNRLARLVSDGSLDPSFDPGAGLNNDARALLVRSDGTAFLAGLFDQYQGAGVNELVALTGTLVATTFLQPPLAITVNSGGTARFIGDATGPALSFQWLKDGVAIAGATSAVLTLPGVNSGAQGRYTLRVTSGSGTVISSDAALTVVTGGTSQIVNLSVLTSLDAPDATFTLGFVIGGAGTSGAKPLLVRAAGPALAQFGVGNPLADPKLQFFAGPQLAGENDNWAGSPALAALMGQVGAFPYADAASKDAAFAATANLSTPANSVVVSTNNSTGAVIAEVYDATPAAAVTATTPRLINVSVLKNIPAGATLTAGFVIGGTTSKTVLVRVIGPTLAGFGVGGPLADPQLTLFNGSTQIATNDNWGGTVAVKTAMSDVGAFALDPASKDAALLISLAPGSYSVQASGVGPTAGAALVEVYEVP